MLSESTDASTPPDLTVVLNAHREGVLAHPTVRSLARACRAAAREGLRTEVVVVLDRPDEATLDYVEEAAADGTFDADTDVRLVPVDLGDLGLARNAGVRAARAPVVGFLDADNLMGDTWLVAARDALRDDPDAVVHPEWIVTFGQRRALWPMIPTSDPRFRPELMRGHNYWDAFSLARRSTYLAHPFAASGPGYGPEDWHWNLETVAAGVRHFTAPGTALFYRVKGAGSLQGHHEWAGHLLAPARLLLSPDLARAALAGQTVQAPDPDALPDGTLDVVRRAVAAPRTPWVEVPAVPDGADVHPVHYRLLHHDLRTLTEDDLLAHWRRFGRAEGRRAVLAEAEVTALARWRPEHYLLLNPDLAHLDDDGLLTHFLQHGRGEGRSGWLEPHDLVAVVDADLDDYLELNPDLGDLTPEQAVAHLAGHRHGRPTRKPAGPSAAPDWLRQLWATTCDLEPLLPAPGEDVVASYAAWGHAPGDEPSPAVDAWWQLVSRLRHAPGDLGLLLLADRLDEPGLAEHLDTVAALEPSFPACVLVTGDDGGGRDADAPPVPASAYVLRLADVPGVDRLDPATRARLVADLAVQTTPRVVHLWGRGLGFDALARHGVAMSRGSAVHVTVDGDGLSGPAPTHPLLGRHPGYLAPVAAVWVDAATTTERLWELARLPRSVFVERPGQGGHADLLRTMPGYGPPDVAGRDRIYATEETAALLAGGEPVALVLTGYEGYANLGDILQAKNLSRQWRSRDVVPVHLASASAVRSVADLDACRRDVGSPHVLLRGWGDDGPPDGLGLVRIAGMTQPGIVHVGGGGYLNRHWHEQRLRDLRALLDLAAPEVLVVSGVQIDETVVPALGELFDRVPPTLLGARDERSRALLATTTAATSARPSFDDATEVIVDWAAADSGTTTEPAAPTAEHEQVTRVGLHLNTSDYAADESVLARVNAALAAVRHRDPAARLTVIQAYDDDRAQVADSLESLPKLRATFAFDRFDVVDLASAARTLDLDAGVVPSLAPLRALDLAIVASYHTAVLLGLLGVPTHLLSTNPFYDDKAAGLGQTATLDEFLTDPRAHGISLSRASRTRREWLDDVDSVLGGLGVPTPRGPAR